MRVTLTQDELFEAIAAHLIDKLNLDNTASIEISFTAGRSPKGYTADVEITYPKTALASKFTATNHDDDVTTPADPVDLPSNPHAEALSPSIEGDTTGPVNPLQGTGLFDT